MATSSDGPEARGRTWVTAPSQTDQIGVGTALTETLVSAPSGTRVSLA